MEQEHFELLESLAKSLSSIAVHLKYLGNGDAASPMGAIENLAVKLEEGSEQIAGGLHAIAEAIETSKQPNAT